MTVISIDTQSFTITQYNSVTALTYNSGTNKYGITYSDGTVNIDAARYRLQFIW